MAKPVDLLEVKAKLEKDGEMTEGLAACFRRAMEMLRKDEEFFYPYQLLIQADSHFLTFGPQRHDTYILWYDQYQKIVQEERPNFFM